MAVYRLRDVCRAVEVHALCCQYVWMMAGSLKVPQGMRYEGCSRKEKKRKKNRGKNFPLTAHPQQT